jgi:hypothetical protein
MASVEDRGVDEFLQWLGVTLLTSNLLEGAGVALADVDPNGIIFLDEHLLQHEGLKGSR